MDIPPEFMVEIRRVQQLLNELRQGDPQAIFQLILELKGILERMQPNEHPSLYAALQYNLGHAYDDLLTGDRASNLIQVIRCYQQALRFWTPETAPSECAMVLNNLGNAYRDLPTG